MDSNNLYIQYRIDGMSIDTDNQHFMVLADMELAVQMYEGLRPIRRSWESNRKAASIITITVKQYINAVDVRKKVFRFRSSHTFDSKIRQVVTLADQWLGGSFIRSCIPPTDIVALPEIRLPKKGNAKGHEKAGLHECRCLICDRTFESEDKGAVKCKACTVSPEEKDKMRQEKEDARNLRAERRIMYRRFNGDSIA